MGLPKSVVLRQINVRRVYNMCKGTKYLILTDVILFSYYRRYLKVIANYISVDTITIARDGNC